MDDSEGGPALPGGERAQQPEATRRARRRATRATPPGSDPTPSAVPLGVEPGRHRDGENDDRLKAEKPPHY